MEFGVELPPPAPVLDRLVFDLLVEGLVEPARRAVEWSVRGYGDSAALASANEMIARVRRQLPLRETVAQLLEAPPPASTEIAPYLGTWSGSDGPNPGAGNRMTVRFRLEDGKAVGEMLESDGADARQWKRVDYLKVLPDGIEFGRMNGMRPLGVWVWSARWEGDALAGEGGFRGIVLPLPSGDMPPTIPFRLDKTG